MREAISIAVVACIATGCGDNIKPGGGDDDVGPATSIELPQAVAGAMWVDPDAYATIPVHAIVDGTPAGVTISVDGAAIAAVPDGTAWTAQIPVAALADGSHVLVADAGNAIETTAELVVGHAGMQWTSIGADGNAATPRLHRLDGKLALTWTAFSGNPTRTLWLQHLDGAGRAIGSRVALVGGKPGDTDVLYARTAVGSSSIGVVFQRTGGPYQNFFTIVSADGTELLAPIALDPADRLGSYSGDITFTGDGYDVVFRTNDGMGNSDVRWMHVDEATHAVTGPIIAAAKGNDDPNGGFDPFTNVTIRHAGDTSLIAFSRYFFDPILQLEILECQIATITNGQATTAIVAAGTKFWWDDDCRIVDDGTGLVVVRAGKDLDSTEDNPPDVLFATAIPLAGDRADGKVMVNAPESRDEPTLVATGAAPILAWADARSYATDITHGEVELYAATLGADLASGANIRFAHSHFVEGTADIRGIAAGSNAILTWIDERHGGSVLDPKPEVYLETAWQ